MRHHVEPVYGHLTLAAERAQEFVRQIAGVLLLNVEIAVNVADEDLVGTLVGDDRLGHTRGHVRREQGRMLGARAIHNHVGLG